jgi:hypothetical protein
MKDQGNRLPYIAFIEKINVQKDSGTGSKLMFPLLPLQQDLP